MILGQWVIDQTVGKVELAFSLNLEFLKVRAQTAHIFLTYLNHDFN